jgi:hypothetical protein
MCGMDLPAPTARSLAAHSRTPTEMGVGICVNDWNRTHAQASRRRFKNESPRQVDQSQAFVSPAWPERGWDKEEPISFAD